MKHIRTLLCSLLVTACFLCMNFALAENNPLIFTPETCIFSISNERFVRKPSALASVSECGSDEFLTLRINIKNTSDKPVTLKSPYIRIDGGEDKYGWMDSTLDAGKSGAFHVYYVNAKKLTPGLHTAALYASDKMLYSCRFNIGRAWPAKFKFPTEAQIRARPADERSPYVATWLKMDDSVRYDAYCVDIKADYLPDSTYCSGFNGYMDLSGLKKRYPSVTQDGISCYAGLQRGIPGDGEREYRSIFSFWDIFCRDKAGKEVTVRAKQTYPAGSHSFSGEGTGANCLPAYPWKAGHWYRMLLQCGTSQDTGNTTVEQWFMDIDTGKWTHTCTFDTGIPESCFVGPTALFLENWSPSSAGAVRSMEFTNVRIHNLADGIWHDITSVNNFYVGNDHSSTSGAYGSWDSGADKNSFYMITTGVRGWGRQDGPGALTIQNTESGDPRQLLAKAS